MTAISIAPLRKRRPSGEVYTRLPEVEAKLAEISVLPRDQIAARCAVEDNESGEYIPSECLVSLVREHRSKPLDGCAEVLLKTLMGRVMAGLPKAESSDGQRESLRPSNMRDEGRYRFVKMLAMDRHDYLEALDFFEIRFQNALRKLRIDARRKICRKEGPLENIEADPVTGTIAEHVERAAGMFDPFEKNPLDDPAYRLRLDQAIDRLPDLQKAIVEMIRLRIPIESKEPGVVNISNTLGKTPKTIASHRDMAYAALSRALKMEKHNE